MKSVLLERLDEDDGDDDVIRCFLKVPLRSFSIKSVYSFTKGIVY